MQDKWKAYAERGPEIGGARRALGGARRAAARGGTITGNENSQMLTEKQVKLVRFHRLYSGRKNGTRSVCTSSVRKKGISVAEIPEMKAVRERQGRPDDADQMVKADLF